MSAAVPRVSFVATYRKGEKTVTRTLQTERELEEFFKPVNLETDFTCVKKVQFD
jgi:hypothetical protein